MEQTRNVFIPVSTTADNLFMCFPNENLLLCDDECKLLSAGQNRCCCFWRRDNEQILSAPQFNKFA